jgi:ornithine carbamoyltransferase
VTVSHDPVEALRGAAVICADTWPPDASAAPREALSRYRLDEEMLRLTGSDPVLLHSMPVRRDEEIDSATFAGRSAATFRAKSHLPRTHAAILTWALRLPAA